MWDLIVSVPDHCLSFYFVQEQVDFGWIYSCSLFIYFFFFNCVKPIGGME